MAKAGTQGKWQDGMVEKRAVAKTSAQQIAQQSEELSRLETVNHWVVEKQNGGAIALAERLARHYHTEFEKALLDSARGGFQSIPELSKGVKSHTNEELAKKAPTKHVATR